MLEVIVRCLHLSVCVCVCARVHVVGGEGGREALGVQGLVPGELLVRLGVRGGHVFRESTDREKDRILKAASRTTSIGRHWFELPLPEHGSFPSVPLPLTSLLPYHDQYRSISLQRHSETAAKMVMRMKMRIL